MIFCEKCFTDQEVIPVIQGIGEKGNCKICGKKNVYIYDTEKHDELSPRFEEFVDIYTPAELLPETFPRAEVKMLKTEIVQNWSIFNKLDEANVYKILTAICKDKYEYNAELFDKPVAISEFYDSEYLEKHSLLTTNSWEDFVDALKSKNRFHTHYVNLELLATFCSYIRKAYKAGTKFYRCRISGADGIEAENMGAPPRHMVPDGRANAKGIRCLYLSDSIETTIYETRAGAYDYVTVGCFELKEDIIVADLKRINQISPFIDELDSKELAINKEHLNKINVEMSKIMRRSDSVLDYVPTQYITDFIKSIVHDGEKEYSGIEYNSVMHEGGYNLAIFEPELFECKETEIYRINTVDYRKEKL